MQKNLNKSRIELTIIKQNGIEKKEFAPYKSPYLVSNSCLYSLNNDYYNIETGEFYCTAYTKIESSEFVFLENSYDKDLSKRGVMQINKKDGSWTVFPN
jgi:hypothetical protein